MQFRYLLFIIISYMYVKTLFAQISTIDASPYSQGLSDLVLSVSVNLSPLHH